MARNLKRNEEVYNLISLNLMKNKMRIYAFYDFFIKTSYLSSFQ